METHLPQLRELNIPVSFDFSDDFVHWSRRCRCAVTSTSPSSRAPTTAAQTREIVQQAQASGSRIVCATRGDEGAILFDGQDWYQQAPDYVTPSIQWGR